MEIWKSYIEGYYEASTMGRIRSVDRKVMFNGNLNTRKGMVLKQTLNSKGYLTVVICREGTRKTEYSHRIIANTFLENSENKPEVNHKDGKHSVEYDNRIMNLEWNTQLENSEHAIANGLKSRGNVKLKLDEVIEIKRLIREGKSNPEIGKLFCVDKATIRNIRVGKNWTHV